MGRKGTSQQTICYGVNGLIFMLYAYCTNFHCAGTLTSEYYWPMRCQLYEVGAQKQTFAGLCAYLIVEKCNCLLLNFTLA
jgi:hypothetical protein